MVSAWDFPEASLPEPTPRKWAVWVFNDIMEAVEAAPGFPLVAPPTMALSGSTSTPTVGEVGGEAPSPAAPAGGAKLGTPSNLDGDSHMNTAARAPTRAASPPEGSK
jgi:hypothetical protein